MEMFWNRIQHPTPVILSLPLQCSNPYETVARLKLISNEINNILKDLKILNAEAAILSRLIYKFKHKFRQDKGFKGLQKINRCLTNYLTMHLPFTLNSIRESLHENCGPSRQMMEWALVRLYGFAHLFHRVCLLCVDAAGHVMVNIKLGHMWGSTLFTMAILSRIWRFAQYLVRNSCRWYRDFFFFVDKLESASTWLPEGVTLPPDIAQTLDDAEYLNLTQLSKPSDLLDQLDTDTLASQETKARLISVIDDNMFDDIGEAVPRSPKENIDESSHSQKPLSYNGNKKVKKKKKKGSVNGVPVKPADTCNKHMDTMDVGLPMLRIEENVDTTCVNGNSTTKKTKSKEKTIKTSIHSINNIKTSQDLLKFYKYECRARKDTSGSFNLKGVIECTDKLQWSMIQGFIKKHITLIKRLEDKGLVSKKNKLLEKVNVNLKSWSSV